MTDPVVKIKQSKKKGKTLRLDHVSKIEGHAQLHVTVKDGIVEHLSFDITEGARFFEAIMRGRAYNEVSSISTRICGICSVAHSIGSLKAVETALKIDASTSDPLRKLLLNGGYVQSHIMHLYFLALPDYLGVGNILSLNRIKPDEVQRALKLRRIGNEIVELIGGRYIHPMTPIIDGFSHLPDSQALLRLRRKIEDAMEDAEKCADLFASLDYPPFARKTVYLSLNSYNFLNGEVRSTDDDLSGKAYNQYLEECVQPRSTAKRVSCFGKTFAVGSLARINMNGERLSESAKAVIKRNKLKFPNYSPFMNNVAQAIEIVHCMERSLDLIDEISDFEIESKQECLVRDGKGYSATEAPRGLLFHEYEIKKGKIESANIITPTAQNIANIEADLRAFLPEILHKPEKELVKDLEKLIRAYDPCISCSTHFLKVKIKRL